MAALDTAQLMTELEPTVEENLNRHMAMADEWMPHEYVPWSLGRDFADLGGDPWEVAQSQLSPIARTALEVNLLTEDNLPSYHREIDRAFGRDSAWGTWVNRWTAEEGRHAFCIRDYLLVTRGVDPVELERARMETMETGYEALDKSLLNVCAYVSFQELATRISHRNTGRYTEEPIAEKLLSRVAKDENLHMIFYRNIVTAALQIAPSQTMRAITEEVVDFQMPGSVIPGLLAQGRADGQGRDLRPADPPRRHRDAAAAAVGRVGARGPRRGRREGARRARGRRRGAGRRGDPLRRAPLGGRGEEGRAPVVVSERNVLGGELEPCGTDPMTGFHRDGTCTVGPHDVGLHAVCAVMTEEFLAHQRSVGNDLSTPHPEWSFPGLVAGDRWCVVAARWLQAYDAGVAAPVVLASTSERALEVVPLAVLRVLSVDVPSDLSAWE